MTILNLRNIPILRRLAGIVAIAIVAIGVFDLGFRSLLPADSITRMPFDIQSPEALYTKLDAIRRFEGKKVVFLGDSLIFGRTMRDHGDADWQSHTLPSRMESRFSQTDPDQPALFMNLGMNGAVPVDLEKLVNLVIPLKPDLIVFDLTLRSFSRDFDGDAQSRPWLGQLEPSEDGRFRGGGVIGDFMVNHWSFYRYRDMLQAVLFDGQPSTYLAGIRDRLDNWFSGKTPPDADPFILLYKAQQRYQTVDMLPDNPQVAALERIVAALKASNQPALAFYATEKASVLDDLIDRDRFGEHQRRLAEIMGAGDGVVTWVGPLDIYEDSDYLDHVHLSETGYMKLTDSLYPIAEDLLVTNQRE